MTKIILIASLLSLYWATLVTISQTAPHPRGYTNIKLWKDNVEFDNVFQLAISNNNNDVMQICHGVVISTHPKLVMLTTAHCFFNKKGKRFEKNPDLVFHGKDNNNKDKTFIRGNYEPNIYPGFNHTLKEHDLALIILEISNELFVKNPMRIISKSSRSPPELESQVYFYTTNKSIYHLPVKLLSEKECNSAHGSLHYSGQLCATEPRNIIVEGHSGSPTICLDSNVNPYVCGLVSYSYPYIGHSGNIIGIANLGEAPYIDWIYQYIGSDARMENQKPDLNSSSSPVDVLGVNENENKVEENYLLEILIFLQTIFMPMAVCVVGWGIWMLTRCILNYFTIASPFNVKLKEKLFPNNNEA